ncbi:winged helix-turn-helix transcriptional regulator [Salinirubellus salinus]|uniref:Winged helix-turn-helix transcriptional regulator n=1 Tax=Salinirubellus salinus TaxID=1364945 RepID=A0A9E7R1S7_9EURY|nr:winged helix-turn-helix transcriptional regulator [Salinirubellus salinus]UWM54171.1 winged helix-turn-helix transcriptional regulator [Salinirubellus salinus]
MTETRDLIAARVRADPGVHFNELVRALDLAPGQVQYHLRRLEWVVAADLYGQTHYYPPGYDADERRALALLRRETAADVVAVLLEAGALPATDVAERVGIARSTLSWHLDRLTEAELVRDDRDARNRVVLSLVDPEGTARLLRRAEPSTPGRLVDRFTRLVDSLLAE